MKILFQSKRLDFRPFELSDASNFYALNNDQEVMKYTGDKAFKDIKEAQDLILNYSSYKKSGFGRWTVIDRDSSEIIGWCGLKEHEDQSIDLGYRYHQRYWNKGYGTEAAKACLAYGFKTFGITEIIGRTAEDNLGSIKILEKIGMKFWKHAPCEGIENSVYYKITKDEFENN